MLAGLPARVSETLFGYDIFISYAHRDGLEYAADLDKTLGQKYTTHLDTRDFLAGHNLSVLTKLRVRQSRLLVVIARPHALDGSPWVLEEVKEYSKTGRKPIIVDVDQAVAKALTAPTPGKLSEWLSNQKVSGIEGVELQSVLHIRDEGSDTGLFRTPDDSVAEKISARFSGDRIETRRLKIISATLVVLVAISIAAVVAANNATKAATRAQAEALAAEALVASSGSLVSDGSLVNALDRAVRALELDPTQGVFATASRIENYIPGELVYSKQLYGDIRDLTVSDGIVYALEGNLIHAINAQNLSVAETWNDQTIGAVGAQSLLSVPSGFIAVAMRQASRVDESGIHEMNFGGWSAASAERPGGGFALKDGITMQVSIVSDDGDPIKTTCAHPTIDVGWVGFLDRDQIAIAGNIDGHQSLLIQNLTTCQEQSVRLSTPFLDGVVMKDAQLIAFRSLQSVVTISFSLDQVQTFNVQNPNSIGPITGPGEGFAVGTQNGHVLLFDARSGATTILVDTIEKLVPGAVTALAHEAETNRLVIAGRIGIVDGTGGGTLASVLVTRSDNGRLSFATNRPVVIDQVFGSGTSPLAFSSNPNGIIFAQATGPVTWMRWNGTVTISLDDWRSEIGGRVAAVSAFGDTVFVALNRGERSTILGFDLSGAETLRHDLEWKIENLNAFRDGVLAVPTTPRGFFNFGSDPVVTSVTFDGSEIPFPVPGLLTSQSLSSITVDPSGHSIMFARSGGVEFRSTDSYDTPSDCLVETDPFNSGQPGAAAAFSPDGREVVLGAWGGSLSIWVREDTCWLKRIDLESSIGWRTTLLVFDGQTVVGRSQSNPTLIRRWNAETGAEIGAAYPLDASALAIEPASTTGIFGLNLPWSTVPRSTRFIFASPQVQGGMDLSVSALQSRLCIPLLNAMESGLVVVVLDHHPCEGLAAQ